MEKKKSTTTTTTTKYLHQFVSPNIWAEALLELLDARDLMNLARANKSTITIIQPLGAAFEAKRTLDSVELEWFAVRKIRVVLCTRSYTTNSGKSRYWTQNGLLHRDDDLPAYEHDDGERKWYQLGELHRDNDRPAWVHPNGDQEWYQRGKWHRENDQPAVVRAASGNQYWFWKGHMHREGDQPAIDRPGCYQVWYWHGNKHRENGLPAVEGVDGRREWSVHGRWIRNGRML